MPGEEMPISSSFGRRLAARRARGNFTASSWAGRSTDGSGGGLSIPWGALLAESNSASLAPKRHRASRSHKGNVQRARWLSPGEWCEGGQRKNARNSANRLR